MRLIDADAIVYSTHLEPFGNGQYEYVDITYRNWIDNVPTVDAVPVRHGKWVEKHHAYSDEESVIEEWQSCRCSECGRYDTRPYMYYFNEPNYCSYCGARMDEEKEE